MIWHLHCIILRTTGRCSIIEKTCTVAVRKAILLRWLVVSIISVISLYSLVECKLAHSSELLLWTKYEIDHGLIANLYNLTREQLIKKIQEDGIIIEFIDTDLLRPFPRMIGHDITPREISPENTLRNFFINHPEMTRLSDNAIAEYMPPYYYGEQKYDLQRPHLEENIILASPQVSREILIHEYIHYLIHMTRERVSGEFHVYEGRKVDYSNLRHEKYLLARPYIENFKKQLSEIGQDGEKLKKYLAQNVGKLMQAALDVLDRLKGNPAEELDVIKLTLDNRDMLKLNHKEIEDNIKYFESSLQSVKGYTGYFLENDMKGIDEIISENISNNADLNESDIKWLEKYEEELIYLKKAIKDSEKILDDWTHQ